MSFSAHTVIYTSGNVTVKAISAEWEADGDEWQSPFAHQTSIFTHGFNTDDTPAMVELKRHFAQAALQMAADSNLGFEVPPVWDLFWSAKAGCGGCECSPGFVTGERVMHVNNAGDREWVDIHITISKGALN